MNKYLLIFILLLAAGKSSAQCITTACPPNGSAFCDLSSNDPLFWNELYWLDGLTSLHDLSDGTANLCLSASGSCGAELSFRYQLFLDLDNNGSQETIIDSDNLPANGTVLFNNAGGPGEIRIFDERPVQTSGKYQFALEVAGTGLNKTACVRWNTSQQPNAFTDPQLPYGTHRIKWFVKDDLNNETTCEYSFLVKDCKAPTVVCLNGLSANLMPAGFITIWASDLLQYVEDNYSPSPACEIGIRKSGTGTGFPQVNGQPQLNVVFDCSDLGTQFIELWARDQLGNEAYCETYVIVLNNNGLPCDPNGANMIVCARQWCSGAVVAFTQLALTGNANGAPTNLIIDNTHLNGEGCVELASIYSLPLGANYSITPTKDDDYLNGVTALDLARISQHILGIAPILSPYALIAADINKSNSVTTFDIVESRKLIQGVYGEFPQNTSWRFVDQNYVFANPDNPFQSTFPELTSVTNLSDSLWEPAFYAIKVGDVDCNAAPTLTQEPDDRSIALLNIPDRDLAAGESIELPLRLSETGEWLGLQFGLQFAPQFLAVESVQEGDFPGMEPLSVAQPAPGQVSVVWFNTRPYAAMPDDRIATVRLRALAPVRLRDAIQMTEKRPVPEAYTAAESARDLQLQFVDRDVPENEGPSIFEPAPNPTRGAALIPLRLEQPTSIQVDVTDAQGRLTYTLRQTMEAGSGNLELPAAAFSVSGVYFWRVQAGAIEKSGKIVRE